MTRYQKALESIYDIEDVMKGFVSRTHYKEVREDVEKIYQEYLRLNDSPSSLPYDIILALDQLCKYLSTYETFSLDKKSSVNEIIKRLLYLMQDINKESA